MQYVLAMGLIRFFESWAIVLGQSCLFAFSFFLDPNRASPEGVYRNGLSSTKMSHDFGHAIVVTLLSRYCQAIVRFEYNVTINFSQYRCNCCRCICDVKMIIAQIIVSNYDVIMIALKRNMQTMLPFVLINRPGNAPKLNVSFCSDYISSILTFMK